MASCCRARRALRGKQSWKSPLNNCYPKGHPSYKVGSPCPQTPSDEKGTSPGAAMQERAVRSPPRIRSLRRGETAWIGWSASRWHPKNNTPENLAWCTHKENTSHAKLHGTVLWGSKNPASRYKEHEIVAMLEALRGGEERANVAKRFGICPDYLGQIEKRRYWKHIVLDAPN